MSTEQVFVRRVVLKNYRSIAACDVSLGPVTFLVGPNGSGKTNFLDALRLVSDSLNSSLDHALRERGGIQEVRRRSSGHPTHFGLRLEFALPDARSGHFSFEVAARQRGEFSVKQEECSLAGHSYRVREGAVVGPPGMILPPATADRLYLVNAAGLPEFRPVYDALSHMGFYNINPDRVRELQPPDKGELLARDGRNLASVIERLDKETHQGVKRRVEEYLERVVPGLQGFEAASVGHMETVEFRQSIAGSKEAWRFGAINMSDGTLRALGMLVALFQSANQRHVRLVGLEEPETALHPAAAGVLRDCILEASRSVQVVVTSHSAELLDDASLGADVIRAVEATSGVTEIAALDEASRTALRDRLYTAGELLRAGQLAPDPGAVPRPQQLDLFEQEV